jgi:hypothetical protein
MTRTTETVIDRYIRIFDRAAHDPGAVEEYRSIFAQDAIVQLHDGTEPVTGIDAIMDLYHSIAADMSDSKHLWTVTVLDDGTLECRWVSVTRRADGRLAPLSGIEHATVNADGLMTSLRNKVVPPESWD